MAEKWKVADNNSESRPWCIKRGKECAENSAGRRRTFGTYEAAQEIADALNRADGIPVSAFDDVPEELASQIRARLLAGDRMTDARVTAARLSYINGGKAIEITARRMRRMRDEVFGPLINDPEAVKALANGPCLNPNEIVRYSHSRKVIQRAHAEQIEMFRA